MTPKQRDAIRLRDAALKKLRADGVFTKVTRLGFCLSWKGEGLSLSLRTPFQKLPPVSEHPKYVAAMMGSNIENLPYGLDIWDIGGSRKVLNIEWDQQGAIQLVSFRRGAWEAKVGAFY